MHIAIDDTYGPNSMYASRYVTGARRTYVAIEFSDDEVSYVRENVASCLAEIPNYLGVTPSEFHFVDIYNRNNEWKNVERGRNLDIFEFFADIYRRHQWRVHVQTVDDRTLADHQIQFDFTADGIDLRERDGQALFLLLTKIKIDLLGAMEPLTLRIDAGREKPGRPIAQSLFREWGDLYDGRYADSHMEPLIQIADFLAFSINRVTHLSLKAQRTETDLWFLDLIGGMGIVSDDLKLVSMSPNFTAVDVDEVHSADRKAKGFE